MSDVPTVSNASTQTAGTVVLIGLGTLFVLVSLDAGGWLIGVRAQLDAAMGGVLGENFSRQLPLWAVWLATALVSVMLPLFILKVACLWRRLVLWLTCIVVMASWAPVLALSAYRPDVLLPCLAALLAGLLAVLFAGWASRCGDDPASDEAS